MTFKNEIKINAKGDVIKGWLKEFDEIYLNNGNQPERIKRIIYQGVWMNQLDFLLFKEKQHNQT